MRLFPAVPSNVLADGLKLAEVMVFTSQELVKAARHLFSLEKPVAHHVSAGSSVTSVG